jgi:hypothetical protein
VGKAVVPESEISGQKFSAHFPVTLTNGGAQLKGVFSAARYLDTASTGLSASPVLLETLKKTAAVKTGKALGLAFRVKSIPAAVAAGTEYLVVRVTDPLGDADLITVPDPIAVATPVVALSAAVAAVHPMSVFFGKSGSAVVSVTNSGNVPGTGVLDITFTVPAGDGTPAVTLAMLAPRVSIKPGRTGKYTIRFKVPATLTAGLYDPVVNVSLNGVSATAVDPATFSAG